MVKRKFLDIMASVLLILFALFIVSPVIIVAVRSFGDGIQPYIDFYVWKPTYLQRLANSLVISITASLGTVVVSVLAAYVFAKVKFKGRDILFYLYIIVMMMPFQVTLLPQYIVSRRFNLYDTPWAMILPGIFAPFAAFLLTQVMKSVPDELIEAARLDTGSTFKIITRIIVPTIRPGIICAWVLSFTELWNAVAEPIILMETREKYPLSILLNEIRPDDLLAFAATVMFFLAPLLLFSFFRSVSRIRGGLRRIRRANSGSALARNCLRLPGDAGGRWRIPHGCPRVCGLGRRGWCDLCMDGHPLGQFSGDCVCCEYLSSADCIPNIWYDVFELWTAVRIRRCGNKLEKYA